MRLLRDSGSPRPSGPTWTRESFARPQRVSSRASVASAASRRGRSRLEFSARATADDHGAAMRNPGKPGLVSRRLRSIPSPPTRIALLGSRDRSGAGVGRGGALPGSGGDRGAHRPQRLGDASRPGAACPPAVCGAHGASAGWSSEPDAGPWRRAAGAGRGGFAAGGADLVILAVVRHRRATARARGARGGKAIGAGHEGCPGRRRPPHEGGAAGDRRAASSDRQRALSNLSMPAGLAAPGSRKDNTDGLWRPVRRHASR